MTRPNSRAHLAALILVVLGLVTLVSEASADAIDVAVCGKITRFASSSAAASGMLVIGGDRFVLPAGAVVEAEISVGPTTCLLLTFDATGTIARVSIAAERAEPVRPIQRARGSDTAGDVNTGTGSARPQTRILPAEPSTPRPVAHDRSAVGQGDLPATGGSAPSGPVYAIVSLATVLLAGFGVFSARRGI